MKGDREREREGEGEQVRERACCERCDERVCLGGRNGRERTLSREFLTQKRGYRERERFGKSETIDAVGEGEKRRRGGREGERVDRLLEGII